MRKKFIYHLNIPLLSLIIISTFSFTPTSAETVTTAQLNECYSIGLSTCPLPFDENIPNPKNMLTWDQSERVIGLRNTYKMYEGDVFHKSLHPLTLQHHNTALPNITYISKGHQRTISDYLKNQDVTGLLILKNGEIAFEYYGKGNTETTLWTSRSVAKSIVTILLGIAVKEEKIDSINDPLVKYLPELQDSNWQSVTLKELIQHTSGIQWDENYTDPDSDFAKMTACEASAKPFECTFDLVKSRPKIAATGEIWSYSTGGAWLVGMLLERVTNQTIAQYLEAKIWKPFGMEQDGIWQALVKNKVSMGGHGFHANLRDWGRFGLFVQNNGVLPNGEMILPDNWIDESTQWTLAKNSPTINMPNGQYGYQWWFKNVETPEGFEPRKTTTSDGTFWALGIYGQSIGINQQENLVIVQWSAQKDAYPPQDFQDELVVFFNAVSEALNH